MPVQPPRCRTWSTQGSTAPRPSRCRGSGPEPELEPEPEPAAQVRTRPPPSPHPHTPGSEDLTGVDATAGLGDMKPRVFLKAEREEEACSKAVPEPAARDIPDVPGELL